MRKRAREEPKGITVKIRESDGNEACYKIKSSTPLWRVTHAWLDFKGFAGNDYRFLCEDKMVNIYTGTAAEYGFAFDGDVIIIDAMLAQTGC